MKFFIAAAFTLFFAFSIFAQMQAEVIVTTTYLRKSPNVEAEKVHTLQKGDKVVIENMQDTEGWYYVSTPNGKFKGWLRRDFVRSIVKPQTADKPAQPATQKAEPVNQKTQTVNQPTPIANQRQRTVNQPTQAAAPSPTPNASTTTPPASPLPSPSETPDTIEDNEVLRIDTEEVNLNVRVVDGNNRPVNNLNLSQFKIYEDDVLQPITSLSTTEVPIINALVIDNSRSLRSQLRKVIEAGKIIIGTNRPTDESAVVRFVSTNKIEVVQDFTPNKSALSNALDNLFVEGGQTAIIDAIYRTAQRVEQYQNSQKKEDVKLRALILVSDGDDRSSKHTEQQLFELLRDSSVQIYAIGFINDLSKEADSSGINRQEKARAFLTRLAQETGGKVYFPNSIDELPQIASDISGELRTQYLISYSPTNGSRDGSFRKIRVVVADGANKEKRNAITRSGRNAPNK